MKTVVLTTEYLGPVSSYYCMHRTGTALIEHCENYQKKSYRNRCRIATANGPVTLSVPLQGGKSSQCPIAEVAISYDTDWPTAHLQALTAAYSNSPFFEYYVPDLEAIMRQRHQYLTSLNDDLRAFVVKALQLECTVGKTTDYRREYTAETLDLRKYHYTNRSVLDIPAKPYWQVWDDRFSFQADLSIVDLLFCKGPEGILYL